MSRFNTNLPDFGGIPVSSGDFEQRLPPASAPDFGGIPIDAGDFGQTPAQRAGFENNDPDLVRRLNRESEARGIVRGNTLADGQEIRFRDPGTVFEGERQQSRQRVAELQESLGFARSRPQDREEELTKQRAQAFKESVPDVPVLRSVASGLQQSVLSSASVAERLLGNEQEADRLNRIVGQVSQGGSLAETSLEGATRSLVDLFSVAVGGPPATIGFFATKAANQAVTKGRDAGLSGRDLGEFVLGETAIELVITSAFQLAGLGGLEQAGKAPLKNAAKSGILQALKQFGIRGLSELPEELLIELGSAANQSIKGVNPDALTPENLKETFKQTTAATLLTVGLAESPRLAASAVGSRGRRRAERRAEQATNAAPADEARPVQPTLFNEPGRQMVLREDIEQRRADQRAEAEAVTREAIEAGLLQDPNAAPTDVPTPGGVDERSLIEQAAEAGILTDESAAIESGLIQPDAQIQPGDRRVPRSEAVDVPSETQTFTPEQAVERAGLETEADKQAVQSLLETVDSPFVEVDIPLPQLDLGTETGTQEAEIDTQKAQEFAQLDPSTAPPIVGLESPTNPGRLLVADGKQRALAAEIRQAQQQGGDTIRALVPQTFAQQQGLIPVETAATPLNPVLQQAVDAVREAGGIRQAARATGIPESTLRGRLKRAGIEEDRLVVERAAEAGIITPESARQELSVRGRTRDAQIRRQQEALPDFRARLAPPPRPAAQETTAANTQLELADQPGFQRLLDFEPTSVTSVQVDQARAARGENITNSLFDDAETEAQAQRNVPREATEPNLERRASRLRRLAGSVEKFTTVQPEKSRVQRGLETLFTPVWSRLMDAAPTLWRRYSRAENQAEINAEELRWRTRELRKPILKDLGSRDLKNNERYRQFALHVFNGDRDAAVAMLTTDEAKLALDSMLLEMNRLYAQQRDAGVDVGFQQNFWPRRVKNFRELRKLFNGEVGRFKEAWDTAAKAKGRSLNNEEKLEVANAVLSGFGPRGEGGPPFTRSRRIETVTPEALQHYDDPFETFDAYLRPATWAIEKAALLGKGSTSTSELSQSVGAIVQQEVDQGRLSVDKQEEVTDIFNALMRHDHLSMNPAMRTARQLIYLRTLGQFHTTLTQLTDLGLFAFKRSPGDLAVGFADALRLTPRETRFVLRELGMDRISQDISEANSRRMGRAVDAVFELTGMKTLNDRFFKVARANSAFRNFQRAARNPDSRAFKKMEGRFKRFFDEAEWNQLLDDLRNGRKSTPVADIVTWDVMESQPIRRSSMPQAYLEHPNGRVLYALQTFTLTQLNSVRRDMIRKLRTPGERVEGLRNLATYTLLFSALNLSREWIQEFLKGRSPDIPALAFSSLLNAFGLSRFTAEQLPKDPEGAITDLIMAPIPLPVNDIAADIRDAASNREFRGIRTLRALPLVGNIIHYNTPVGRGWHITREDAAKEFRSSLNKMKEAAIQATLKGDRESASELINAYNRIKESRPDNVGPIEPLRASSVIQAANRIRKEEHQGDVEK